MTPDRELDHLDEAKGQLEAGCNFLDEGNGSVAEAERRIAIAGVHAQISHAEELRKLNEMLGRRTHGQYAEISVDGHVTTGAP